MPRFEPSGTEDQIVKRLRRGDGVQAIREELGCATHRVRKIAARHGIEVARAKPQARRSRADNRVLVLQADTPSISARPFIRLTLLLGWGEVLVTYPDDDDGVITIKKVKSCT